MVEKTNDYLGQYALSFRCFLNLPAARTKMCSQRHVETPDCVANIPGVQTLPNWTDRRRTFEIDDYLAR